MNQIPDALVLKLQQIANNNKVAIVSFVAPQDAVRISPAQLAYATITETEMYKLEQALKVPNLPKNLHLIVHTPGGRVTYLI